MRNLIRNGFTLLETVIVLAIFSLTMAVSLYNLRDYQAKVEEKQALEWFKNNFKNTFNYCYLNGTSGFLNLEPENHAIRFQLMDHPGKHKKLILPKTLSVKESKLKRYVIYLSGQAAPITITFQSKLTHREYIYKIQMGWGEIIETQGVYPD